MHACTSGLVCRPVAASLFAVARPNTVSAELIRTGFDATCETLDLRSSRMSHAVYAHAVWMRIIHTRRFEIVCCLFIRASRYSESEEKDESMRTARRTPHRTTPVQLMRDMISESP